MTVLLQPEMQSAKLGLLDLRLAQQRCPPRGHEPPDVWVAQIEDGQRRCWANKIQVYWMCCFSTRSIAEHAGQCLK